MFGLKRLFGRAKEREEKECLLCKEEIFALGLGDLEHERLRDEIKELSLITYLREEHKRAFTKESLATDTTYILQKLWSEGSMVLMWNHPMNFNIEVRDIVAFDAVRFTEFIRQLLYMELIEEEIAWGWLFLNAQRVQDSYEDWQDFKRAYFKGLTLYRYGQLEGKEQEKFNFESEFYRAMNGSKVKIEWLAEEIFSQFESVEN